MASNRIHRPVEHLNLAGDAERASPMLLLGEQGPAGVVIMADPPEPGGDLLVGLRYVPCRVTADPVETSADGLISGVSGPDIPTPGVAAGAADS
jgi:hypothetical protein